MPPEDPHRAGFVSLVGRPNVGKSTLLNRLLGTKISIISDKPQTTRYRIVGVKNYPHAQVAFIDTPGIHRPLHRLNVRMRDAALETLGEVDVIGLVIDVSESTGAGDRYVLGLLENIRTPVVLIMNKIDRVAKSKLLPLLDRWRHLHQFAELVPISAETGLNVDRLEHALVGLLPLGEPLYPKDFLTDQSEPRFIAETVREKLLQHLHAELPFSTAVTLDELEEQEGLIRLRCTILVERDSQKGIVIGASGEQIKRIGTDARQDLEARLGKKIFLDLHVKVRERWRDDELALDEIGIEHVDPGTGRR